ncbi:MAG: hypothetical protein LBH96_04500 [Candidatus Peribacteria bacterium]|jgi:hypothetical protein|nr:hypothetical protein [Candidatus Peribacteria bacterium]
MEQSGGNPVRLIRNVIRNLTKLKGKERLHIAYNIMRSLTEIAKSKKIPLSYVVGNDTRTLSVADDGNILLESDTVDTTTHRSNIQKVFDYNQHFASTQNRDCGGQSLES